MSDDKKIGVFWGKTALCFVEVVSGTPNRIFAVPLGKEIGGSIPAGPFNTVSAGIVSLIHNTLRQQKISAASVNLSLPAKDIIFRSFVIPWMRPNEIKGVVEFEASKYVPFALSELVYSFYPMTAIEGNVRRIYIIFVAIKKVVMESCSKILEDASVRIDVSEPGTVSLIRALVSKNLLPKDETIAMIERGDDTGNIVMIDRCVPQFVREFQLRVSGSEQPSADSQIFVTRIVNEVRISLNYFNRQEERFKIKRVMFVSSHTEPDVIRRLEEELRMPVLLIQTNSILPGSQANGVDFLKAYGAAINQSVSLPVNLDFSGGKQKTVKTVSPKIVAAPSSPVKYKMILSTLLVCLPILVLTLFFSFLSANQKEIQKAALIVQLKSFKDVSAWKMQQDNEKANAKLIYMKELSVSSEVFSFLEVMPTLLPEKAWIDEVDIVYPDIIVSPDKKGSKPAAALKGKSVKLSVDKLVIDIKGYVYSNNSSEQFKLVNELLSNFKKNKKFSDLFEVVNLEAIQAKDFNGYPATYFFLKSY